MSVNILCQGIKFHFDTSGASMSCFTLQKVFQKIYETLRSEIKNTEQSSKTSNKTSSEYNAIENNKKTPPEDNNRETNIKPETSAPQKSSFSFLGYEILVSRDEKISGTESLLISFLGYTRGILCDNTIDYSKYLKEGFDYSELSEEEKISISIQSYITLVFAYVDLIEEKNMSDWAKKMSYPLTLYYLCIFLYYIFLSNKRNNYCKIIYRYILIPYTAYAYKLINELHKDEFISTNQDPEKLLDCVIRHFSPMNLNVDPTREDADDFNDFLHQIQLEDIKRRMSNILSYNVEERIARELVDDYVNNYALSLDERLVSDLDEEILYGFSNEIDEIILIIQEELTRKYPGPKELEKQLNKNILKRGLK